MKNRSTKSFLTILLSCFGYLCLGLFISLSIGCSTKTADSLVIYSARKEHLIKPVLEAFTKDTGIKVVYFTGKAAVLNQRLKTEGETTEADILITVDAGNLWHAKQLGILEPVQSQQLESAIPSHLKDKDNHWFGFSLRARPIVYHTDRISPKELSTYEDLATEKWQGRLLLRTSKKVYNQSLVAMLIHELGLDTTKSVVKGWVRNLATPVFSSDTQVLKAILAGQGDVGIVNSYYFGRLKRENPELKLKLFWPNQTTFGTHVNISGAGVVKHSNQKEVAVRFLEWLSQPKAQSLFATLNLEYPVNSSIENDPFVSDWGVFIKNKINMTLLGDYQRQAIQVSDESGYR